MLRIFGAALLFFGFAGITIFGMVIMSVSMNSEHGGCFVALAQGEVSCFAEALSAALRKLFKGLKDPDYNYFIHTAPVDGGKYPHYHWHLEIMPKTSTWAGFELGTGIEISTIEPEKAAAYLRKQ